MGVAGRRGEVDGNALHPADHGRKGVDGWKATAFDAIEDQ